jgi:hypothetical protein
VLHEGCTVAALFEEVNRPGARRGGASASLAATLVRSTNAVLAGCD